ncbi:MAG: LysR substrate-binding domain-containing protein [Alphaproteobacteria bacterium]
MKLDRLRYFAVLAEELHFGKAAKRLKLSQPSLTLQIQNIEAEIGLTLLIRSRRGAELTPAGRQFLLEAKLSLHHAEQATIRARQAAAGNIGRLSIGFTSDYVCGFLPDLLFEFHSAYPDVRIESRLDVSTSLSEVVADRSLDVAFLSPPLLAHPNLLKKRELKPTRIVALLPVGHRCARAKRLKLSRLKGDRFVLAPIMAWTGFYQQIGRLFDEAGFAPDIVHQVMGPTMVENLVAAGVGVSLISATSAHARLDKVVTVELDSQHAKLSQAAIWHEQNKSPVLESFLTALQNFNKATR